MLIAIGFAGWLYLRGRLRRTKQKLVEKENENLKLERENLKLEIFKLEEERDKLKVFQKENSELAVPIKEVIKERLDMINCLLAKEITNNDDYAEPYNNWIQTVHGDQNKFMDSMRLAISAAHPKLMGHLEHCGLTTEEINNVCLYAIGLRGKDVGEYTHKRRHYIVSHEIRKKLGLSEHETNLGLYVRRLMVELDG